MNGTRSLVTSKTIEERSCSVCGRETRHYVHQATDGVGRVIAEQTRCQEHDRWVDGRIGIIGRGSASAPVKPPI